MELQKWMLDKWNDKTISDNTGINIKTIRDWRMMMYRKSRLMFEDEEKRPIQKQPKYVYPEKEVTKKRKRYVDERNLQEAFVESLTMPYKQYVSLPFGIIDVLTDDTIYELKTRLTRGDLQQALGQITLYGTMYPKHKKVIVANILKISFELEEAAMKTGVEILIF